MADLTITAANIVPVTGFTPYDGLSGATVTAGLACYLDAVTNTIKIADNDTSAATATVKGISLHAALSGQPLRLIMGGDLAMGAILTAGVFYYLGEDGGICPVADLATPEWVTLIGYGKTTSVLAVNIINTGVAL